MTKNPWPEAPIEDRLRMFCGEHQYGVDRARIGKSLRVRRGMIDRALEQLVKDGWLSADHPAGKPGRHSSYELNRDRVGLAEMRRFWAIEYGYRLPDFENHPRWVPPPSEDPERTARIVAAMKHRGNGTTQPHPRVYRHARAQMLEQYARAGDIWNRLQEMHATDRRERSRDLIHLEPTHGTKVPSPEPGADVAAALLDLAARCRKAAREDAGKWRWLITSANAARTRVRALNGISGYTPGAFDLLSGPAVHEKDDALRQGLKAAAAARLLSGRAQYAPTQETGWAGDVMVAYTLRDMARQLDKLSQWIVSLPEVADAAQSPAGRDLLGAAPDLAVPSSPWSQVQSGPLAASAQVTPLEGDVISVTPADLRTGDQIVAVRSRSLSDPVAVLSNPVNGAVDLVVIGGFQRFSVPLDLLGNEELGIRR